MRVMALDYGSKAIGLALSDELQLSARPLTTLRRQQLSNEQLLTRIAALIGEHEVGTLVVGLPYNVDGSSGTAVERVKQFIATLAASVAVPIETIDECLSSRAADELLREQGISARERRERSDEYAALIILQDYLASRAARPVV